MMIKTIKRAQDARKGRNVVRCQRPSDATHTAEQNELWANGVNQRPRVINQLISTTKNDYYNEQRQSEI